MILIGYRHGLRASELCDLQWSHMELNTGRLHVRRAKNGSPSVHRAPGRRNPRSAAPTARTRAILARIYDRAGHPVLTEEAEVAEASDSNGEPDERA
jgi:integrase